MGTESYGYTNTSWLDRLTSYNGTTITYDNIGNPLSYNNGSSYSFTWKNGRELASVVKGGVTTSYKYGADGLRTQKTYGSTTYNYYYSDGNLVRQTWGTHYIDFLYDETGTAYSFVYDGIQYYYVKNLQGDVTQIRSIYGTVVVEYSYDAWGNVLSVSGMYANTLGQDNPIRYRGYYYDFETGFYYLNNRYYDSAMRRFINADDAGMIAANGDFVSYNLYAYCGNNPTMRMDHGGEFWHIVVGAFVGGLIGAATKLVANALDPEKDLWDGVAMSAITGAASGALAATGVGIVGQIVGGATISMAGNAIQQGIDISQGEQESFNVKDMIVDGVIGGIAGAAGGSGASQGNTKTATKLGKQLTKRICNTGEIKKAVAYYGKNMMNGAGKPINELGKALFKSGGIGLTLNSLRSLCG